MDVTSLVASKFAAGGHLSLFFAEGTRTPDRRRDADRELYWHGVQAGRVALKGTTVTGLPSRGCAKKWSRAGESGEVEIPAYTVVASGPGWRWREELARQVCRSASRGGARYRVNVRSGGFFCLDPAGPAKRRHTNLDTAQGSACYASRASVALIDLASGRPEPFGTRAAQWIPAGNLGSRERRWNMSNGHISKNAVRHRVEELVGGEYRLKFSKDVLSWQESYAYHYEHVRGSPTHDNRVSCAKAKLTILKNKISDAFVMHGINTNAAIDYYFEATVGWVCNSFRRGYLTWGGTRNRWLKTPITECVCGMMAMIDALTMPPETFDVVKRMVPRIINGCSNDVLATEFNMDVDAVDKTRSLIGWAADRHSLQGVILQSVMAIDKEDVLSRQSAKWSGCPLQA